MRSAALLEIFGCFFFLKVITSRGGRFLEAPVSGSQQLSNDGMLVIVAAGDRTVYEDCSSCFQAMGKTSFFLGTLFKRTNKPIDFTRTVILVQSGSGVNDARHF